MAKQRSPWEFRARALIVFVIYWVGFIVGYYIDGLAGGSGTPTFVRLGMHWGDFGVRVAEWILFGLALSGFLLRWWGSSYHNAGVVFSGRIETSSLTAAGPYRFVRNPLYLGNLLQGVAISAIGPPAATVIITVLLVAFIYRLIFLEEAHLRAAQGVAYEQYCAQVPRLVPRLRPANIETSKRKPDVLYGFITELGTFGFAVWVAYLPIFNPHGPTQMFYDLLYVAVALFVVGAAFGRRRSKALDSAERQDTQKESGGISQL